MRIVSAVLLSYALAYPAIAQDSQTAPSAAPEQPKIMSEEKAAEIRAAIAAGRKRQATLDRQNTDLWVRWTHAVCIGCDPTPKGLRIVHTYPHRVLQGIPAAEDDMRERRGLRI